MTRGLTVPDKLLLAAFELDESGKRPFSAEDLVIAAWRHFPDAFGLAGYRDGNGSLTYPDSNRVFAEIMGSKPIRKRGFLVKVGSKMYQISQAGREQARLLLTRPVGSEPQKINLERGTENEMKRLFASKAVEKVKAGRQDQLTFYDAFDFWGISPRTTAIELEGRFANFGQVVQVAKAAAAGQPASFEHGGASFGAADLDMLAKVHDVLLEKFSEEIALIRERTDERK